MKTSGVVLLVFALALSAFLSAELSGCGGLVLPTAADREQQEAIVRTARAIVKSLEARKTPAELESDPQYREAKRVLREAGEE